METGLLLGRIREECNISASKIAHGICDLSTLTKFETGKRKILILVLPLKIWRSTIFQD